MNSTRLAVTEPWYRHPWPWILMAGPAIVVVAGFVTLALAIQSSDGLVADDYYKQGKAINMTLTRDARAHELGYQARAMMDASGHITVNFVAATPALNTLRLSMHHPTRAGFDREILLARTPDGGFAAAMPPIDASRWRVTLEDEARTWRLNGDWNAGEARIQLGSPS